jgi:hypothetical protein
MQCKQGQVSVEKQGLNIIFPVVSQSFLYRCVGVMLQECHNKEVVKKQLQEIYSQSQQRSSLQWRQLNASCLQYDNRMFIVLWGKAN